MAMAELELPKTNGLRKLAVLKNGGFVRAEEQDRGIPYLKSSLDSRRVKIYDPGKIINGSENVVFIKPQK